MATSLQMIATSDLLSAPKGRCLTQGSIFSGAMANRYVSCPVSGLVITAKCDIANDKAAHLNYLPVIPLRDWLSTEGCELLAKRALADAWGSMGAALTSVGLSRSVMESQDLNAVESVVLQEEGNNAYSKAQDRFRDAHSRYEAAQLALESASINQWQTMRSTYPKLARALFSELILQRLAGYYFLPQITLDQVQSGCVVLLREVRVLPNAFASAIVAGLGADALEAISQHDDPLGSVRVSRDDYALPLSVLKSPHIEHLMQAFSTLFCRIGLPDPYKGYDEALLTTTEAWR